MAAQPQGTGSAGGAQQRPAGNTAGRTAPHFKPSALGLVFIGGLVGVAVREGFERSVSDIDGVPVVVPVVNLLAAFLLGYLYEGLARLAPGKTRTGHLKLLIGTGFCGGLSTYSSLATDTATLLVKDRFDVAVLYALGTLVIGALATFAGIALGSRLHRRTADEHELKRIEGHAMRGRA